MELFTGTNAKRMILEWVKTFSQKTSFFSSKKIERFVFGGVYILMCAAYIVYGFINKSLTALDITLIGGPLLIAAGYNLSKTEKEKIENKESNGG